MRDFIHIPHQQNQQRVIPEASSKVSEDTPVAEKRNVETPVKYPSSYSHELGRCIVDILSSITLMEYDLLPTFSLAFQENCKEMLISENGEASIKLERLVQFLLVLERYALRKGETWPLVYIVRPTLAVSFTSPKSLDSTHAVRFLSAVVSVFGAREGVRVLSGCHEGASSSPSDKQEKGLDRKDFIDIFKQRCVPWCLSRNDSITAARIDFLIVLLDEECFADQWSCIISYVVNLGIPGSADSGYVALLSILLKKARGEIAKSKVDNSSFDQGSYMHRWHRKLLDSAAVAVIRFSPPFQRAAADFLCSAIGCSAEEDQIIFLSKEAFVLIFKEILEKLVGLLFGSSFSWIRQAGSLLTAEAINSELQALSSVERIENARFALDVLSGSLYGLTKVEESGLVSNIIVAIFLMSWECSMVDLVDCMPDYELEKARSELSDTLHALLSKVSNRLCQSLSANCREKLRIIVAKSIRSSIFSEPKLDADKSTSLCFKWLLAVLDFVCPNPYEEEHLLEQLLYRGSEWSPWISENILSGLTSQKRDNIIPAVQVSGSQKFISLLGKLILERGIEAVFHRSVSYSSSSSDVTMENHAWLAAEMLTTWEWPGGSCLTSFLPMLYSYCKNEMQSLQERGILDATADILLDAALMEGKNEVESFSHVWVSSADDVEHIEEPFLRALLSLLTTVFNDKIWQEDKARSLFELLTCKLLVGQMVNINCLRILPPIMSVLVRTLYQCDRGSTDEARSLFLRDDQVQAAIIGWLERTLSYQPLSTWQAGQGMEEWFQLVISCYPPDVTDRRKAPKSERNISPRERTLLLKLFRKQNHGVRSWIQSAVVMMEDVTENINELVASKNLDTVVEKLEDIVFIKDHFRVHLAENALLAFSCFCGLPQPEVSSQSDDPNTQIAERWGTMKDRIVEGILRIIFCTGLAEAIASSYGPDAASTVASSRLNTLYFWKLVAWSAIQSSPHCRERAVKSIDFWALSKGAISSLYSILFSSKPVPSLQFAAYVILSIEPVSQLAIGEDTGSTLDPD